MDSVRALRACTIIILSGPGSRARQVRAPHGWAIWLCTAAVLSIAASLSAGRQARAFWESTPHAAPVGARPVTPANVEARVVLAPTPPENSRVARKRRGSRARPKTQSRTQHGRWSTQASQEIRGERETLTRTRGLPAELALFDVHGRAGLRVHPFDAAGRPDPTAFKKLKEFLRCRRTGLAHDMNPRLVALLTGIAERFEGAVLHVISAHRAADDRATKPTSQHTRGTAADIRVPGVGIATLARVARELGAGGVGQYTATRFVHIDVRKQSYYWRDVGRGAVAMRAPP